MPTMRVPSAKRNQSKLAMILFWRKGDGEIKSAAWSADGKLYIGSKNGLSILKDGKGPTGKKHAFEKGEIAFKKVGVISGEMNPHLTA